MGKDEKGSTEVGYIYIYIYIYIYGARKVDRDSVSAFISVYISILCLVSDVDSIVLYSRESSV